MTQRPAGGARERADPVLAGAGRLTPSPPVVPRTTALALAGAAGLAFALLSAYIAERGPAVPWIDASLHRWVLAHRGTAGVRIANDLRWAGVTWIVLPLLVPVGAAAAAPGSGWARRVGSGLLLGAIAGAGVLAEIEINHAIGRARPPVSGWAGSAAGASFPSGHTTNATLFALSCAWACASRVRPGWPRRALWAGAAVYACAVGWSRVWLGVHWPTDVAGGWLFGLAWIAGATALLSPRRSGPAAQ